VAPGMTSWAGWVDAQQPLTGIVPPPRASMIYTSGTTGRPKGVRRLRPTAEQAARQLEFGGRTYGLKPDGQTVALMNGPMYHSAPNAYAMLAA
ncbi:AMP-binding protein, partial [Acinetobacter baumannii]